MLTGHHKISFMKISKARFVFLFLLAGFAIQFISNSLLGPEVALFPGDGEWFPGTGSSVAWKNTTATILYPLRMVLIGPISPLFTDPDPPPPIMLLAFGIYWTAIALVLYYVFSRIFKRRKSAS